MNAKRATARGTPPPRSGPPPWVWIGGLAVIVMLGLGLIVAVSGRSSGEKDANVSGAAAVKVTGDELAPFAAAADDPAAGRPFPALTGTDLDGRPLTIDPTNGPSVVVFVAHWCPHCRREIPNLVRWIDDGLVGSVPVRAVATGNDPNKPNYPPTKWLAGEHWKGSVLVDTDDAAATAAGLTSYPYFVAIDAEGRVVARASGELTEAQFVALTRAASEGTTG